MADTPLRFSTISSSKKLHFLDGSLDIQDGSSLSLGLAGSSSVGTMFPGKDVEEDFSGNLPQDFLWSLRTEKPNVDLELSLTTGSVESDVTAVTHSLLPFRFNSSSSSVQAVDEGSTSSQWRFPFFPALQTSGPSTPFHQVHDANPVIYGSSQRRRNSNVKDCQFIGCTRGARGASRLCIAHGGGRRCQRDGCNKGAEGKTVFCKAHGGGRRCEYLGCTKSAEGRTDYCISHGGGRRCSHEGCTRAARGKSGLCIRHGGGKRCKVENCTRSAEGITGLCISHGGGRRCQYPACTKGAQGSTMFCKAHGGGKRCSFVGCTKGAEGSTSFCKAHGGGKRCTFEGGCSKSVHGGTLFCVGHGGGKRCAAPGCTKSARGRTSYCVRHGGGKRCKYDGCGKSAQGRTDFCKAHGGGKRCSWGQNTTPCDRCARGKNGLCAEHNLLVLDHTHGLTGGQQGHSETASFGQYSLPEGRVHGGSLMAMLKSNIASSSDPTGASGVQLRTWV